MEQRELMEKQNFCETAVQESSGFLKNEGQKGVSAELLNGYIQPASEIEKDFTTRWESIEDLDTQKIQPFELIPDYLEPTSLLYPLVVSKDSRCYYMYRGLVDGSAGKKRRTSCNSMLRSSFKYGFGY